MNAVGQNVSTYLSASAQERPNHPALVSGAMHPKFSSLSFAKLNQIVDQATVELFRNKISPGDRTLLFVNPGPDLIIWAFALFRLGAIPVVIDPGMGLRSFMACIRRTKPDAMVGVSKAFWLSRFLPKSFQSVRRRYLVRPGLYGEDYPNGTKPAEVSADENSLAAIVFTSGSTGAPKGVLYLHRTFASQISALKSVFEMEAGEVDMTTLPIFGLFNPALGITSVLPDIDPRRPAKADPKKLIGTILEHNVTTAFASPVIGERIATECTLKQKRLPSMRRFLLAGAPVPPCLAETLEHCLPNGRVIIPYGATEALPVSWTDGNQVKEAKESILAGKGSLIGRPTPEARVVLVPVKQAPLPDYSSDYAGLHSGEVGEISVSGPMVTAGYDRMPGATCDARFKIGNLVYHRMGDLGYFDGAKNLRFLGRKVECVQSQAGPIETERCEPAIAQLAGVKRCALIGIGKPPCQEPCLVIEPDRSFVRKAGEVILRKEILLTARRMFPEYNISRVIFERKMPVDARHNAKIHRLSLSKKWTPRVLKKPALGKLQ